MGRIGSGVRVSVSFQQKYSPGPTTAENGVMTKGIVKIYRAIGMTVCVVVELFPVHRFLHALLVAISFGGLQIARGRDKCFWTICLRCSFGDLRHMRVWGCFGVFGCLGVAVKGVRG